MSYDNPIYVSYNFNANDFGNGNVTKLLRPPKGKRSGSVVGVLVAATETFNQVTTQARVQAGITGDLDKYADLPLGALASGASLADGDVANTLKGSFDLVEDSVTAVTLTMLAPTGGTPAGIGDVCVTIAWA